ncbi:MAG: acyl-CoA dehydrogenase [Burkholderiales bacterium]|nr:acyl-CoA dehydrogenase [Burkholderiales bacterium]
MDITLDEDQAMILRSAQEFAREALTPARIRALEADDNGFDARTWRRMADLGWAGVVFPERYGGTGLGMFELGLIVEALGQGAVPSPLFSTVVEAGLLLLEAGSEAQRAHWLPRIAAGGAILTTALLEPGGALGSAQVRACAQRAGAGFRLSGTKLFVRDAGAAAAIICLARSGAAADDLTWFMIPADAPGLARRRLQAAGGESLWEVTFADVAVPADAVVGAVGAGWPLAERLLLRGAALKAAELVGIGQASLDLTLEYARTRVQFGVPIGSFQGVQHHCTEMYRDLTVCRLLAWQACARLGAGRDGLREAAMAKAKASEAIPALTRTAHQIHGAVAYYRDYPLELYYHRAIAAAAAYGDAGHQRRALAGLMRGDLARFQGEHRHDLPVHQG